MRLESFKFKSGELTIFDEVIQYKTVDGKTQLQMNRKNFEGINKTHFKMLAGMPPQYGFLSGFVGVLLILVNIFTAKNEVLNTFGGVFLFFGVFLVFGFIFFDALLGIKLTTQVCSLLFGQKGYKISLQNNSGADNIEFQILEDEKIDIDAIMKYRINR